MTIDNAFSHDLNGRELAELENRWAAAAGNVSKAIVPVVNGILRREGVPFRCGPDGDIERRHARTS